MITREMEDRVLCLLLSRMALGCRGNIDAIRGKTNISASSPRVWVFSPSLKVNVPTGKF